MINNKYIALLPIGYRIEETELRGQIVYKVSKIDNSIAFCTPYVRYADAVTASYQDYINSFKGLSYGLQIGGSVVIAYTSWTCSGLSFNLANVGISLCGWWGICLGLYILLLGLNSLYTKRKWNSKLSMELMKINGTISKSQQINPSSKVRKHK